MNVTIRQEKPADYWAAENVTREAFWNHFSPGCDEHYLLHVMRTCPAYVPELSLVAEHEGKIVGHVICVKSLIHGDGGKDHDVLTLGPISVLPEHQGKGVGGRLITHMRQCAQKLGFSAILLYGDPDYYTRQGFMPAERWGIRTADNMVAVPLQACELCKDALFYARGRFVEDAVYVVDTDAAAAYDKRFPYKEKRVGAASQERFKMLVAMRKAWTGTDTAQI